MEILSVIYVIRGAAPSAISVIVIGYHEILLTIKAPRLVWQELIYCICLVVSVNRVVRLLSSVTDATKNVDYRRKNCFIIREIRRRAFSFFFRPGQCVCRCISALLALMVFLPFFSGYCPSIYCRVFDKSAARPY